MLPSIRWQIYQIQSRPLSFPPFCLIVTISLSLSFEYRCTIVRPLRRSWSAISLGHPVQVPLFPLSFCQSSFARLLSMPVHPDFLCLQLAARGTTSPYPCPVFQSLCVFLFFFDNLYRALYPFSCLPVLGLFGLPMTSIVPVFH